MSYSSTIASTTAPAHSIITEKQKIQIATNAQGTGIFGIANKNLPKFLAHEVQFARVAPTVDVDLELTRQAATQSLKKSALVEQAERSRRTADVSGELARKQLAVRTSTLARPAIASPKFRKSQDQYWITIKFLRWARVQIALIEEEERSRRMSDRLGEEFKKTLAAKTSLTIAVYIKTPQLRNTAAIIAEIAAAQPSTAEIAAEKGAELASAALDTAKSIGSFAVRAAMFFGAKAVEGAHMLGVKAAEQGEVLAEKAAVGAHVAAEKAQIYGAVAAEKAQIYGAAAAGKAVQGAQAAAAGAQFLGEKALEGAAQGAQAAAAGAQILGQKAVDGAVVGAQVAVLGAQVAAEGAHALGQAAADTAVSLTSSAMATAENLGENAKILGGMAIESVQENASFAVAEAQVLGGMAVDKTQLLAEKAANKVLDVKAQAKEAFADFAYTLTWSQLEALEESERLWRTTEAFTYQRFWLALRTSALIKDSIISWDQHYSPESEAKRFYATSILEEFERARRMLDLKTERLARANAKKASRIIRHYKRECIRAEKEAELAGFKAGFGFRAAYQQAKANQAQIAKPQIAQAQVQARLPASAQKAYVYPQTAARSFNWSSQSFAAPQQSQAQFAQANTAASTSYVPLSAQEILAQAASGRNQAMPIIQTRSYINPALGSTVYQPQAQQAQAQAQFQQNAQPILAQTTFTQTKLSQAPQQQQVRGSSAM